MQGGSRNQLKHPSGRLASRASTRKRAMGKFIVGVVIGVLLVLGAGFLFLTKGGMPVATKGGPLPLERFLISRAWKVKNGIRLTGMPGFEGSLSEDELWQVSLLLLKAEQLPDSVKAALR